MRDESKINGTFFLKRKVNLNLKRFFVFYDLQQVHFTKCNGIETTQSQSAISFAKRQRMRKGPIKSTCVF